MNAPKAVLCAVAMAVALCPLFAPAQNWPAKPIRVIIPHPAGGPADVPPRAMGQALAKTLGQPFVIENRLGADGIIGAEACAKAAPDGYTLCSMSNGVTVVDPVLFSKMPFDVDRDLVPIVHTGTLHTVIMVGASVPVNSMQELIAAAKVRPEAITFGTYGQITLSYFVYEWLRVKMGAQFLQVPYKGASQALQALLAGEVQIAGYALGAARKHMQAGKVKALAINSEKRLASLPDVPTLREVGIDVDYRSWFGFYAPAGTANDIVRRLNAEIAKLIVDPQFAAKFLTPQGFETDPPAGGPPEQFARFIRSEREEFRKMVKTIGIKPQ